MIKICKQCKLNFTAKNCNEKACSDECRKILLKISWKKYIRPASRKQYMRNYSKKYRQLHPELKEKDKLYRRQYYLINKEKHKEWSRKSEQKPERKAYHKLKSQTLKYKQHMKQYRQTAKYKANQVKCVTEYRKTETGKKVTSAILRKRKAIKKGATIGEVNFKWINERDNFCCQSCLKPVNFTIKNRSHIDYPNYHHLQRLADGGEHSNRNLSLMHRGCHIKLHSSIGAIVQQNLF